MPGELHQEKGQEGVRLAYTSVVPLKSASLHYTTDTGTRTLAANGLATVLKVGTNTWFITGAGLT